MYPLIVFIAGIVVTGTLAPVVERELGGVQALIFSVSGIILTLALVELV